jgi:hypothetical protein
VLVWYGLARTLRKQSVDGDNDLPTHPKPHNLSNHTSQQCGGDCHIHALRLQDLKPKHHMMLHMIARCRVMGSPRFYSTYRDESLNGSPSKCTMIAMCHAMVWCFRDDTRVVREWVEHIWVWFRDCTQGDCATRHQDVAIIAIFLRLDS